MFIATSLVLATSVAAPEVARRHFVDRLALETDPSDLHADMAAGVGGFVVVDACSCEAYGQGYVSGALALPHREIDVQSVAVLSRDDVVVVYCWGPHCNGVARAAVKLAAFGYCVKEMIGGIDGWRREGLPVSIGESRESAMR